MKSLFKNPFSVAAFTLPLALLAGCGGGGGSSSNPNATPTPDPGSVASTNLAALTNSNVLLLFNARTPGSVKAITIAGLPQDRTPVGLDYRYAPDSGGQKGLYLLAGSNTNFQLYRLTINSSTALATPVGATFAAPLNSTQGVGFDFNPNVTSTDNPNVRVDRIRIVGEGRGNFRVVPNTGAIVDNDPNKAGIQLDDSLAYDTADQNTNVTPRIVAAAYTNNDTDLSTGTVNYALDASNGNLVTQGRADDPNTAADETVSPNTGRLFTVGNTSLTLDRGTGFDIAPTSNLALFATGKNLYSINLATGSPTSLGAINVPAGLVVQGLAILPN